MSTSVDLSCFSVLLFKELYYIQKNKENLQGTENKGIEMKMYWILQLGRKMVFFKNISF